MENLAGLAEFELLTLKSGVKTLRSKVRRETFHPGIGPIIEANILHVDQQRLVERSAEVPKFVIWDVGLGAAANVLAAITALKNSNGPSDIEIHSFDKTTSPLAFALQHAEALGYVVPYQSEIRQLLAEKSVVITPKIRWWFHLGDFRDPLQDRQLSSPHSILYDPYSAIGNMEMWTLEHFQNLWKALDPNVPCLLSNYTRSTAIRTTLLLAGFFVGRGCDIGEKAETTLASNHLDLLQFPLDRSFIERVRLSDNSAPLRSMVYSHSRMNDADFELLQKASQFDLGIKHKAVG